MITAKEAKEITITTGKIPKVNEDSKLKTI